MVHFRMRLMGSALDNTGTMRLKKLVGRLWLLHLHLPLHIPIYSHDSRSRRSGYLARVNLIKIQFKLIKYILYLKSRLDMN